MSLIALRASLKRNLDLVTAHLTQYSGERGDALYVNSYDGEFSFDAAPVVTELGLVDSEADLTHSQGLVSQTTTPETLYDLRNDTLHTYDGNAWSTSTATRDDVMVMRRLYYSPYTNKVFLYDTNGRVEQLRGTNV